MVQIILAARGRITTHFGEDIGRGWPHRGIDQGHGDGLPVDLEIRAPAAGRVIAVGRDGSYGLRIIILHDDFTVSLLAHHARQFVTKGDRVTQGQLIAEMGNTGTIYVHNHQEYRDKFGGQLDPLLHLAASGAALSTVPISDPLPDLPPIPLGDDDMIRIQAPNRGIALIGPGYFRPLAAGEELENSEALMTKHLTGNDRQFDLWVSLAFDGRRTPAQPFDAAALVAALVKALPTGGDSTVIAAAVDAVLADNFAAIPGAVRNAIVK